MKEMTMNPIASVKKQRYYVDKRKAYKTKKCFHDTT